LKITGNTKYETGKAGFSKVLKKRGTLTPVRTMYMEINILSTNRGENKLNNGYAIRVKPRLGKARNW
jgi:hypothetical protein